MWLGAILLVLGIAGGVWVFRDRVFPGPKTPADLKVAIRKYLLKQSGQKSFNLPDEPPGSELPAPVVVTTNAAGTTNKAGRVRVPKAPRLGLPGSAWSAWFRSGQEKAASYPDMYRLIGEQLTLAERLLTNAAATEQVTGLAQAGEAGAYARTNAVNPWLGARICEAYLWPNLALVETNKPGQLTTDALLNLCDIAFKEAGETNNIIRNYEMLLARGSRSASADVLHYRLARVYMDMGENQKALEQFKQIKSPTAKMTRDLGALEVLMSIKKPKP